MLGSSIFYTSTINRVAKKMRTYFEMGTDGHRFLCFKFEISCLRRYLRGVSIQLLVRLICVISQQMVIFILFSQ